MTNSFMIYMLHVNLWMDGKFLLWLGELPVMQSGIAETFVGFVNKLIVLLPGTFFGNVGLLSTYEVLGPLFVGWKPVWGGANKVLVIV